MVNVTSIKLLSHFDEVIHDVRIYTSHQLDFLKR